jgi:uncharacterized membrane protein YqjE
VTSENNGKTMAQVANELKHDLMEFLQTRLEMLRAEVNQKVSMMKVVIPMFAIAFIFLWFAFMLMSVALVAGIAVLIGWGWSFLAVGLFYCLIAGLVGGLAYREIRSTGLMPKRTLKVLQQDQVWLQGEARSQL